jgi:hypothetical protein
MQHIVAASRQRPAELRLERMAGIVGHDDTHCSAPTPLGALAPPLAAAHPAPDGAPYSAARSSAPPRFAARASIQA